MSASSNPKSWADDNASTLYASSNINDKSSSNANLSHESPPSSTVYLPVQSKIGIAANILAVIFSSLTATLLIIIAQHTLDQGLLGFTPHGTYTLLFSWGLILGIQSLGSAFFHVQQYRGVLQPWQQDMWTVILHYMALIFCGALFGFAKAHSIYAAR